MSQETCRMFDAEASKCLWPRGIGHVVIAACAAAPFCCAYPVALSLRGRAFLFFLNNEEGS